MSAKVCDGLKMQQNPADRSIGLSVGSRSALQATANRAYNSVLPFSKEKIPYFYSGPIPIPRNPIGFPRPKS
jgi:hypothetical protein